MPKPINELDSRGLLRELLKLEIELSGLQEKINSGVCDVLEGLRNLCLGLAYCCLGLAVWLTMLTIFVLIRIH